MSPRTCFTLASHATWVTASFLFLAPQVLHHAYSAVVPISPLPPPVLPLSPYAPGPAHFGPTLEAASPWLSLALYQAARWARGLGSVAR